MMHYEKNYTGNERFYGFCVDILETISHEVGFDYILDLVPDRKYGAKDPETGQWNGMVAQLMKYVSRYAVGFEKYDRKSHQASVNFCCYIKDNMMGTDKGVY